MKKAIVAVVAIIIVTGGVYLFVRPRVSRAVPAGGKAASNTEKAERETSQVAAVVKLNAEQRDKLYNAVLEFMTEKEKVRKVNPDKNSADAKARIEALRDSLEVKLAAILGPEEFQTVKATANKQPFKDGRGNN